MKKLTKEAFLRRARVVHGWKYDYSKVIYKNCRIKICIICPEHGEFWQLPSEHLCGKGCQKCARELVGRKIRNKQEDFIERSREMHGDKYDYTKAIYTKNNDKVCIICPKHGEFWQRPSVHMLGAGCPKCKASFHQYQIYNKLKNIYKDEEWIWEYRADWTHNYVIDIYNPRINLAIEYNGEQHYMPVKIFGGKLGYERTKHRDAEKLKWLNKHNCIVYIIPYYDYDIDKIINDIKTFLNYENTKI